MATATGGDLFMRSWDRVERLGTSVEELRAGLVDFSRLMQSTKSIARALKVSKSVLLRLKQEATVEQRRTEAFRRKLRAIGEEIVAIAGGEDLSPQTRARARRTPRR